MSGYSCTVAETILSFHRYKAIRDITSKIGTKKAALKADPKIHLHGFGTTTPLTSATIQRAEQYLVNVVDVGSKSNNIQEIREHQFHFSKTISHQNLPPTSQGLEPHIYRAFYNAYTTMHVLDAQLHVEVCGVTVPLWEMRSYNTDLPSLTEFP